MLKRLWRNSLPSRLAACLSWALAGAKVHPAARLMASRSALKLGRGAKVSAGVVLDCVADGRIELEEATWLAHHVELQTDGRIHVGRGTTVQRYSSINGNVRIGCFCIIAPSVFISSGTHPFRRTPYLPIRVQEQDATTGALDRPVNIHDDCWLGVHVVIAPGVTLGKGVVVGANAVVTQDCPPYSVVAGAPARTLTPRLAWSPPDELDATRRENVPYLYSGLALRYRHDELVAEAIGGMRVEIAVPWRATSADVHVEAAAPLILNLDGGERFHASAGSNVVRITALHPAFESDSQLRFRLAALTVAGSPELCVRVLRTISR